MSLRTFLFVPIQPGYHYFKECVYGVCPKCGDAPRGRLTSLYLRVIGFRVGGGSERIYKHQSSFARGLGSARHIISTGDIVFSSPET